MVWVDRAPITIMSIAMENILCNSTVLWIRIHQHYTLQLRAQLSNLLFNAEFLGSPLMLVESIGTGVQ